MDGLKRQMDIARIDISVVQNIALKPDQVHNINKWAVEIQGDNIKSFGTMHPELKEMDKKFNYLRRNSIKGIKIHPTEQGYRIDDTKMYRIYEKAFNNNFMILFQMGDDLIISNEFSNAKGLKKVINDFPGGRIIGAHMGVFLKWEESQKYLIGEDIYLDTSCTVQFIGQRNMEKLVLEHGIDKIIFGTDLPWQDPVKEINLLQQLHISPEDKDKIFYKNYLKLMSI